MSENPCADAGLELYANCQGGCGSSFPMWYLCKAHGACGSCHDKDDLRTLENGYLGKFATFDEAYLAVKQGLLNADNDRL